MRAYLVLIAAVAVFSGTGNSSAVEMERVLIPIPPRAAVIGAEGSLWETTLSIVSRADVPVRIVPYDWHCPILCPPVSEHPDTPSGVTFSPRLPVDDAVDGAFLFVAKEYSALVGFQLRTRDLSRQLLTHGTEIPIVREPELRSDSATLLNVPLEERFRSTLRVYDAEPNAVNSGVIVRFFRDEPTPDVPFDTPPDELLAEMVFEFQYSSVSREGFPGYIYIPHLASIPELLGVGSVRIDIESLNPELRFWAFVSVTHNETQHVTLVTPQ